MKKTLIALAAVAATGAAFAQSTVTIGGTLEIAPISNSKLTVDTGNGTASTSTKLSRTAQGNTWSTNVLTISGTEDLGGGLKASFTLISDSGQGSTNSGIGNRERALALAGDFGTVRIGRFVPAPAVGFQALSGAGSATLLGSAYGFSTGSDNLFGAARNSLERQDNMVQYTSPTINGFTVNVAYGNNSSDRSAAANTGKEATRQTGLHLGYVNGPLSLGVAVNDRKAEREAAGQTQMSEDEVGSAGITALGVAAVTGQTVKTDLNWFGASYDLGVARLHFAHVSRKDVTTPAAGVSTTNVDANVNAIGLTVPVDAFTFRASMYNGKDKRGAAAGTDDTKLSGYQLSAAYALSKRTSVIAATGQNKIERKDGASSTANRKNTATTLTVNHTF
jgi:predicted porin